MRTPISAQPHIQIVTFAATVTLLITLTLIGLTYALTLSQAQPSVYRAQPAAAPVVAPAAAPAPVVVSPDAVDTAHFESAAHSEGVYDVLPIGAAVHDPESASSTTGTLMYVER